MIVGIKEQFYLKIFLKQIRCIDMTYHSGTTRIKIIYACIKYISDGILVRDLEVAFLSLSSHITLQGS